MHKQRGRCPAAEQGLHFQFPARKNLEGKREPKEHWVFDSRKKLARVHSPAMRKILALLVLPPLIVAVFIYHAEMMTRLFRFQQVQVQYLALRDTD